MPFFRNIRKWSRLRRQRSLRAARATDQLRALTMSFCEAATLEARSRRAGRLFAFLLSKSGEQDSSPRLANWLQLMEQDRPLGTRFQEAWLQLLREVHAVPLFADAGLPAHPGLFAEVGRRIFSLLLPTARADSDAGWLFISIFSSRHAVERFSALPAAEFARLAGLLWPPQEIHVTLPVHEDLRQALRLLATRIAGRGSATAIRDRGTRDIHDSPFYKLVFVTERFVADPRELPQWRESIVRCRDELEQVHLHMEDAGVSSALVYDLMSIDAALNRMELLGAVHAADDRNAARTLLQELVHGRIDDTRLVLLFRQNLTQLARKTVERTGHSGEHYVARDRSGYWRMWRAAAGGGLLTVITAAVKSQLVGAHLPLFVEGFLIGTDYAVTFVLLQIFHFALATKQPSMTAAALAGIVRSNRGEERWHKISTYAAQISRTQLAAAFGNVISVCIGGIAFQYLWTWLFHGHFLSATNAEHAYQSMNPLESGTAIFAAFTGVLLWIGALAGGWVENFIVFNRIPQAIVQHPLSHSLGLRHMQRMAGWLERNAAAWSNSIVLGYLLGLSPVIARFFGIPLDVRHVTLSTGMVALAAAQYGLDALRQGWLYFAIAGIAVTFVLNLSVSFTIASVVALRAYSVPAREQLQILRYVGRQFLRAPMQFIFPGRVDRSAPAPLPAPQEAYPPPE
jgi:site-specific recombinase